MQIEIYPKNWYIFKKYLIDQCRSEEIQVSSENEMEILYPDRPNLACYNITFSLLNQYIKETLYKRSFWPPSP